MKRSNTPDELKRFPDEEETATDPGEKTVGEEAGEEAAEGSTEE